MVINKYAYLSGILLLTLIQVLSAQTRLVEGKVMHRSTEEPISSAVVHSIDKRIRTITDKNGLFSITVPDTVSYLTVSALGSKVQTVSLVGRYIGKINIYLEDSMQDIEEVIVNTGYVSKAPKTLLDIKILEEIISVYLQELAPYMFRELK